MSCKRNPITYLIKKKLLEIVNEKDRLSFIKDLFNNIQSQSPISQNGQNIPEA
ncbi:MAG: hypothetical protein Ct9H300mP9_2750 [Candidatus Neomarinimicrobiota bacterium]|nr:MAG: hypothetical protein Ct9H300mP9_2750 [Candidatus Neomarinimicrobiota bacterium]